MIETRGTVGFIDLSILNEALIILFQCQAVRDVGTLFGY